MIWTSNKTVRLVAFCQKITFQREEALLLMYKVLLAEDEVQVLGAMLTTIPWEKYGFEVPTGCQDGKAAIETIQNGFVPNLVIADICMPFVDGLELAKFVSENLPDTMVVILTGFNEFKYAQKAIQLKVYDYILKPVTPNKMAELLTRYKQELDERELKSLENSMDIVSSYFLNKIVTQRLDAATIQKYCRANRLSISGDSHVVAILDVDLPAPATVKENKNLELMRYGLFNIAQETAMKYRNTIVFQGKDGITNLIASGSEQEVMTTVKKLTKEVSDFMRQYLGLTASAGIGEPVDAVDELYCSRSQADVALGYRFFYGDSSIISEVDVNIEQSGGVDYNSCEKKLIQAIRNMNRKNAADAVDEFMEQLRQNRIPLDRCVLYCLKMMMRVVTLTNEVTGEMNSDSLQKVWEDSDFSKVSNLDHMKQILQSVCDRAFEILEAVKNYTVSSQVAKAESYIKENYSNPELSLNMITEHLAISTSYFSAIFKAKTGSTFVEYLTHVRMEKAKQILAFTDRRAYEVAEDVGFSDPHYFSVAFKRVTGVTPKEYRDQAAKKGTREATV